MSKSKETPAAKANAPEPSYLTAKSGLISAMRPS